MVVSFPAVWVRSRFIHHLPDLPVPPLPVAGAECVKRYLPGVAAPPTGLGGDAQAPAAGLVGHEGELAHGAASESVEGAGQGHAHGGCPGNQEQEDGTVHPGEPVQRKCHLFNDLGGKNTMFLGILVRVIAQDSRFKSFKAFKNNLSA